MAMSANAHDRHPDEVEQRHQHAEAFGAEPVQPAERELALLVACQAGLAPGQESAANAS